MTTTPTRPASASDDFEAILGLENTAGIEESAPREALPAGALAEPRAAGDLPESEPRAAGDLPEIMNAYLREIGHTPLLTPEQEIALARRVAEGDKAAADAMAAANLRLVVSVARRYNNRGLPLEDLVSEGNLGLLRAIEKYDWRLGYRFSTYAVWWIRQAVSRALAEQARSIRLPIHVGEALNKRARAINALTVELGREPTAAEVAAATGLEMANLDAAAATAQAPLSLGMAVGDDGEEVLGNVLPDEAALAPEECVVRRVAHHETWRVMMDVLSERERTVLVRRFGLDGTEPMTLDDVARSLGVTRERVRQIEVYALRKLRRPTVVARLKVR